MIRRARRDGREARRNEEGRRERIEKGDKRGDREKRKRQKDNLKRGLRDPPFFRIFYIRPCSVAIVSSFPQGMTSWSSSIKIWFLQAYRMRHGVKQNAKICAIGELELEVFILGGQRIDQQRKKGWWRGRRERIERGNRERIEIERKKTKGN